MKKCVILLMILMFSSCTVEGELQVQHKPLLESIKEKQEEHVRIVEATPEVPAEPQYETVYYYEVKGTTCNQYDGSNFEGGDPVKAPDCGLTFWQCDDGLVYACMTNFTYKVKSKEVRVE